MIGKLVEYIVNEGFDIWVHQRESMLMLCISKMVGEEICSMNWALSRNELMHTPDFLLLEMCKGKLQQLRNAIEEKASMPHE